MAVDSNGEEIKPGYKVRHIWDNSDVGFGGELTVKEVGTNTVTVIMSDNRRIPVFLSKRTTIASRCEE